MKYLKFSLMFLVFTSFGQYDKAYQLYDSKGKTIKFSQMQKKALASQVVLFGEFHDNPITHWLQFELTQAAIENFGSQLTLSFEMFEQDQQGVLDRYVSGLISEKQLKDSLRLWLNYDTDYAPLVNLAKENRLKCVAANVQRKYASLLFKKGRQALDTLPAHILAQMASPQFELDTNLSQYAALNSASTHMPAGGGHMMESQAFKDATMAKFILENVKEKSLLIHYNGAYHSDFYQGIMWYLKKGKPELKMCTISTVTQDKIDKLEKEHIGRADFIICVPEHMTRTH